MLRETPVGGLIVAAVYNTRLIATKYMQCSLKYDLFFSF